MPENTPCPICRVEPCYCDTIVEDGCPLQEHLRFYGPKGPYCGACKVLLP